jgi:replication-associated recombination protein RarA
MDALILMGMQGGYIDLPETYQSPNSYIQELEGGVKIPFHLRNAPTKFMKKIGYGKDYKYTPDFENEDAGQDYLPEELKGKKYI